MKKILFGLSILISINATAQDSIPNRKINARWIEPEKVFEQPEPAQQDLGGIEEDKKFLQELPKSYENMSPTEIKNFASKIEIQLQKLIGEKEALLKSNASKELIDSKTNVINSLGKEKKIVDLNIKTEELKEEAKELQTDKEKLKKYLIWAGIFLLVLILGIIALLQRKTIKVQDSEIESQLKDISKKNSYLEHAARIIRHDMHSGINTYIPRGLSSLEKRLSEEDSKKLKIDGPLKMIKEGLLHTQKVYKSVYEFTNLVKENVVLDKKEFDLKVLLQDYINKTSYSGNVEISDLCTLEVNEILFCNAVENLVKNGLKYNDSEKKLVKIYIQENNLIIQDNGRGLQQEEFEKICFSYQKKKNKDLDGEAKGLGLNIALTIFEEHGFGLTCEKNEIGTKMKINIKKDD
jgi:K+-sensing histidine kinase KdpD